jgi:hypothetical protein
VRSGLFFAIVLLTLGCGGAASSGSPSAPPPTPAPSCGGAVGDVDVDDVVAKSHERHDIEKAVAKQHAAKQLELEADEKEILRERDDLEKSSKVLSKDALKAKADAYQAKILAYQQKVVAEQKNLEAYQWTEFEAAKKRVRFFVSARGKELAGNLLAIVEKHTPLWVRAECPSRPLPIATVDLTELATAKYDEQVGAGGTEL